MAFPQKVLVVHDDPLAVPSLASRLRQLGARSIDTDVTLEGGVLQALTHSYELVAVSVSFAERLPGKSEDVRRRFSAPVIFLSPNGTLPEALGLLPWEFCLSPYSEREIRMVVASAQAMQGEQRRSTSLAQRLRNEERLADFGRVAVRAGGDFGRLFSEMRRRIESLETGARPEQFEALNHLETLVGRGERLCRQLTHGETNPEMASTTSALTGKTANPFGTVLIIDDDDAMRELAGCVVRQVGLNVLHASSGEEGLQRFQNDPGRVGAVILDLSLPVMSGLDVLAAIHSIRPGLPVIVMSGFGDEVLSREERAAIRAMLRKPFSPDALRAALQRAKEIEPMAV